MTQRLAGRIALITGASRGIGAAVARHYAREGAQLVLAARTVGGLEETDDAVFAASGTRATLVPLDVRAYDKIDALGAALAEKFGRLDILVGNAATLGDITPLAHADPGMWERVLSTNLTANWRLLRGLDPLLRRSEAGRAIFVTSGAAKAAFAYWGAYAVSKAGLEMLVRTYAAENAKTAIRAHLVDPGVVATALRARAFPGEDPATLPAPDAVTELFVQLAEASFQETGRTYRV
jgi:NAD(P)-dependent dehydrogenase (short-subunit alcohol dehydrogenase family)